MQHLIDAMAYPPTMTYTYKDMQPTGVLKDRIATHPHFFKGNRLLDIGCSKGYFSIKHNNDFKEVVSIDSSPECISLCKQLHPAGNYQCTTFRDFHHPKQFDRIFIGNVHHYLYRDAGHAWIHKLAALSSDEVLIEGPIGMDCQDMHFLDEHLRADFNRDAFIKALEVYFNIISIKPSVAYTSNRYVTHLKRKKLPYCTQRTFAKKYQVLSNIVSISLASFSPISNGLVQIDSTGWKELHSNEKIYKYKENEQDLLKLILQHQIWLAKNGYWDIDFATINFFKPSCLYFDKGCVVPIKDKLMAEDRIKSFIVMYNNSYSKYKVPEYVPSTLLTKDSHKIEAAWARWLEEIN